MINSQITLIIFFVAEDGKALYSQQKQDWELTVTQMMSSLLQYIIMCMHHYNTIQNIFTALKIFCVLPIHLPSSLVNTDLFIVSLVFPFPESNVVGIVP